MCASQKQPSGALTDLVESVHAKAGGKGKSSKNDDKGKSSSANRSAPYTPAASAAAKSGNNVIGARAAHGNTPIRIDFTGKPKNFMAQAPSAQAHNTPVTRRPATISSSPATTNTLAQQASLVLRGLQAVTPTRPIPAGVAFVANLPALSKGFQFECSVKSPVLESGTGVIFYLIVLAVLAAIWYCMIAGWFKHKRDQHRAWIRREQEDMDEATAGVAAGIPEPNFPYGYTPPPPAPHRRLPPSTTKVCLPSTIHVSKLANSRAGYKWHLGHNACQAAAKLHVENNLIELTLCQSCKSNATIETYKEIARAAELAGEAHTVITEVAEGTGSAYYHS